LSEGADVDINEFVMGNVKEILNIKSDDIMIEDNVILEAYNFDSIKLIQLIVEIENHYGVFVPDESLVYSNLNTISKIVSEIECLLQES